MKINKKIYIFFIIALFIAIAIGCWVHFNRPQFNYFLTRIHWCLFIENKLIRQNDGLTSKDLFLYANKYGDIALIINGNNTTNLNGINELKYLQLLNIFTGKINDLTFVKDSNIVSLFLDENVVLNSLHGIEGKKFIDLCLDNLSSVQDFTPLRTVKADFIRLENAKNLNDLSIFNAHTDLEGLDIRKSSVTDLTPLALNSNLEYINIAETEIKDLSPLRHLPKLKKVVIGYINPDDLIIPDNLKDKIDIYKSINGSTAVVKFVPAEAENKVKKQ